VTPEGLPRGPPGGKIRVHSWGFPWGNLTRPPETPVEQQRTLPRDPREIPWDTVRDPSCEHPVGHPRVTAVGPTWGTRRGIPGAQVGEPLWGLAGGNPCGTALEDTPWRTPAGDLHWGTHLGETCGNPPWGTPEGPQCGSTLGDPLGDRPGGQ
jgi:hypothetical protein